MAESVRGVNLLQSELERARESLKGVDDNIKKLTGRDPTITGARPLPRRVSLGNNDRGNGRPAAAVENRLFNLARRGIVQEDPGPRRRPGGAFARLGGRVGDRSRDRGRDSGDEEEFRSRPTLQSSVVAASAPREERSRQSSIDEQTGDRKGQARNRRMFGLLLGTLQKFKVESLETKKKEEQRIEIEKKLEDKFAAEKEEILEERRQLFLERRRKQFRIKLIEQKMEMAQNHEDWERETKKLQNFILTKAKPHIFYMPKTLTPDTESKMKDTKLAVDAMIESRRKKLDKEIAELMSQVHEGGDDDHDDGDDDDEGAESDDGHHGNGKENREEHGEEDGEKREKVLSEREMRDKEREQRDRERRMKEAREEERQREGRSRRDSERNREKGERRESEKSREREKGSRRVSDRSRESERGEKSGSKRGHSRSRSRSGSRSRERDQRDKNRDRHESGKRSSAKKKRHSDEHEGSSKSRRKSREEGKAEKKSKVWEPMEDEEEEEFVGSKDESESAGGGSIQSKMLQMAGMATSGVREGTAGGRALRGDDSDEDNDEKGDNAQSRLGDDGRGLSTDHEVPNIKIERPSSDD